MVPPYTSRVLTPMDLTGQRFGRLVALTRVASTRLPCGAATTRWRCRCDCGKTILVARGHLRSGHTASCGCFKREKTRSLNAIHGEAAEGHRTPEYACWVGMIKRCENPRVQIWPYYGGRGITVCDRWRSSFTAFLSDMGRKPSAHHSIDRINNDGNYGPGNCRWATRSQQRQNQRPLGSALH